MIDELIVKDFDTFKNEIGNLPEVYQCTTKEGLEGIRKYGTSREFTGKNSNFYGQGAYTTFTLRSTLDNVRGSIYGKCIIRFALNDGFKNFLFFDEEMNRKYNNGEPIEEQIKRLCPPDIVDMLNQRGFFQYCKENRGQHHTGQLYTAHCAKMFFEILKGERLSERELTPWQKSYGSRSIYNEKDLSRTKVRGYIFVGGNDGEVAVIRDYDDLVPIAYCDLTAGDDPRSDSGWHDIFNKETFDNIAGSVDIGTHIRGKYPETPLNTKTICGFVLVKKGGKYNYVDAATMEELLPVSADFAADFDPQTGKAKFIIGGEEFEYSSKIKMFIEDGVFTYDRSEFEDLLRDNGVLNEGVIKAQLLIERMEDL